jgi:hypothetical protein
MSRASVSTARSRWGSVVPGRATASSDRTVSGGSSPGFSGERLSREQSIPTGQGTPHRWRPLSRIGTATFGAIILYQPLREPAERDEPALGTADSGVDVEAVRTAGVALSFTAVSRGGCTRGHRAGAWAIRAIFVAAMANGAHYRGVAGIA